MRAAFILALFSVLIFSCKKEKPDPTKYYDVNFKATSSTYPIGVVMKIGETVWHDTAFSAFDTTITHQRGGLKAFINCYRAVDRPFEDTALMSVRVSYDQYHFNERLQSPSGSANTEIALPE